jgi:peptidoglycan/xylan/chitin deacetylase (PgdA/CDA1 family)
MALYLARRLTGRTARWIEYKDAPSSRGSRAGAVDAPAGAALKARARALADRAACWTGLLARRERALAGGLTVLMYHRVLDEASCARYPFPSLAMPVDAFAEQVRWLARQGDVLPLGPALQHVGRDGPRARPLFALTFDDGYEDSADTVAGILESEGVRGTFFVTTGFVGTDDMLWFDRAGLLLAGLPDEARRRAVLSACPEMRAGLPPPGGDVSAWVAMLKRVPPGERDAALDALERTAGGPPSPEGCRGVSVAQLVGLHRRGHEIGSHTVSHAVLPWLDDADVERELTGARSALRAWLGRDVPGFCYPNGDRDARIAGLVERAGHDWACSTREGIHRRGDDPYDVPRIAIVPGRVAAHATFDPTAFRRELCGLYRGFAASAVGGTS